MTPPRYSHGSTGNAAGAPTRATWTAAAMTSIVVPPMKLTRVAVRGVPTRWRSRPLVACCHAMPTPAMTGMTSIHHGTCSSTPPCRETPTAMRASSPPIRRGTVIATTPAGP